MPSCCPAVSSSRSVAANIPSARKLVSLLTDESGQDLVEHAIMVGLAALAVFVAIRLLGGSMSDLWQVLR